MAKQVPLNCKLLVVGESDVGKTAIIHKYINDEFREIIKSTVGVDISMAACTVDSKIINLQIWDTAGQERFHALGDAFYRNTDACLLVYDITSIESFQQLDHWRNELFKYVDIPDPESEEGKNPHRQFPLMVIGNKIDRENERKVPIPDAEKYAQDHGCLFAEVSAKTGDNIPQIFQKIAEKYRDYNRADVTRFDIIEPEPDRRSCNC